jgi:ubiquitin-protein ligase
MQHIMKGQLPVHPGASIFLVQHASRPDMMRALVTGPCDTPYSGGAFIFDLYFPADYPNIPPLVHFSTTGYGVRFNPNLYPDGKVCLSLLGTWHGAGQSEKWNPDESTLYQVLVSIQGMIFVEQPFFNEPGYEGIRGSPEGHAKRCDTCLLWTISALP